MDKQEKFIKFIQNPGEVAFHPDLNLLQQILEDHPYFQSAHLLLTIAYHQQNSIFFDKTLKTCALYAPDRTVLYNLVNHPYKLNIEEPTNKKEEKSEIQQLNELIESSAPAISSDQLIKEIQEKHGEETEQGSSKKQQSQEEENSSKSSDGFSGEKSSSYSFYEWLKHLKKQKSEKAGKEKKAESVEKAQKTSKSKQKEQESVPAKKADKKEAEKDLLDNFLKKEPQLKRPKAEFYDPSDKAKKSILEDDELVSETLAKIYYEQGHYKKAIEIYEKLSLLYPKKFDYFAEKIKEVKARKRK